MRSVPARALILGVTFVAGCKPEPFRPDAGPLPDGPAPYWSPKPKEADNWDIQLASAATAFDVSTPRAMYVVDLWDAVPTATPLDYKDGAPVMVPAGAHPGAIAQIHALNPPGRVVCHVSTGAIQLDDPDAMKLPSYKASPPDRPTQPEANSVIGWSTPTGDNERFIDIRNGASRSQVLAVIDKRFELAQKIQCDAVVTKWNDQLVYAPTPGTGFGTLTTEDYQSWSRALAGSAHQHALSIGLRTEAASGVEGTDQIYDWLLLERCAERDDCMETAQEYQGAQKAVFALEYDVDQEGNPTTMTSLCSNLTKGRVTSGIIKTAALDKSRVGDCRPALQQ